MISTMIFCYVQDNMDTMISNAEVMIDSFFLDNLR